MLTNMLHRKPFQGNIRPPWKKRGQGGDLDHLSAMERQNLVYGIKFISKSGTPSSTKVGFWNPKTIRELRDCWRSAGEYSGIRPTIFEDASVEPSSSVPTIQAGQLIRTPDSVITASGSVAGNIVIAAPNTNISSSLVVLPETFADASSQLPPGVGRNARWRRSAAASACFPESSVPSGRQCPRAD